LSDEYSPPPTTTTTLPPVHGVPLLSSTLVGAVIGFGIITFMLRTLFDIREPKKVIEYFIVLAVIVLTVIALIALFA
jgi:phosphate/sulfate permease